MTETAYRDRGHNEDKRTGCSKDITAGELPHSRHELGETAREAGHADDDIGGVDPFCVYIVQGENECGGCEREQTTKTKVNTRQRASMGRRTEQRGWRSWLAVAQRWFQHGGGAEQIGFEKFVLSRRQTWCGR